MTILINEHVMNVLDEENGLLSNSVKSIVCDSDGNYYIGTTEGLSQVSLSSGVKVTKSYKQTKMLWICQADGERACCDRDGKREDLLAEGRRNCTVATGLYAG